MGVYAQHAPMDEATLTAFRILYTAVILAGFLLGGYFIWRLNRQLLEDANQYNE